MTTREPKTSAADVLRQLTALPSDQKVEVALGLLRAGGDGRQKVGVQLLRLAVSELEERADLRAALPKDRQPLTELVAAVEACQRARDPGAEVVYPPGATYHGD